MVEWLMSPNTTIEQLRSHSEAIRARGATALYIFGSRARGDHRSDSDLDGFVDYDPAQRFSLTDLIGIELLIERELGLKADLTTHKALHPLLREQIEREAIRVF
jgi:uncharacterized protein